MRISTLCLLALLGVPGGIANAEPHKATREARSEEARAEARAEGRATADRLAALMAGEIAITGASRKEITSAIASAPEAARVPAKVDAPKEKFLSAGDVSALVAPHEPAIERCYLDAVGESRRGARVDLRFVIARAGDVLSLSAAAPALPARTLRKLESCIRGEVASARFPERRNDTTAVVPYIFQRTEAPNAGPQLSCWNPKGCHGAADAP
jgi:hypothetical protein